MILNVFRRNGRSSKLARKDIKFYKLNPSLRTTIEGYLLIWPIGHLAKLYSMYHWYLLLNCSTITVPMYTMRQNKRNLIIFIINKRWESRKIYRKTNLQREVIKVISISKKTNLTISVSELSLIYGAMNLMKILTRMKWEK